VTVAAGGLIGRSATKAQKLGVSRRRKQVNPELDAAAGK